MTPARDYVDNIFEVVAVEAMLVCMIAYGIDEGVNFFFTLLRGYSGS